MNSSIDLPKQHVAIIGCGASGLVTLKELLAEGHTGIIFERALDIGGIFKTSEGCHNPQKSRNEIPGLVTRQ
jgi:cation diffusion facilitator CzcD-associated flavoprotein CzcO